MEKAREIERVTTGRAELRLAVIAALLALLRYLPVFTAPIPSSHTSEVAVFYGAISSRYWTEFGFARLRGAPHLQLVPSEAAFRDIYYNHPPGYAWLIHGGLLAFGRTPAGLRAAPVFLGTLAAVFAALAIGRRRGRRDAILFAILFAVLPLSFRTCEMLAQETGALAAIMAALWWRERMSDTRASAWPIAAAVLVGLSIDWPAAFAVPALLLVDRLSPPAERRSSAVIAAVVGAAIAGLAITGLYAWWAGSPAEALARIREAGRFSMTHVANDSLDSWARNQWRFLVRGLTTPFLLVGVAGLLAAVCTPSRAAARQVIAFFLPGLLHVLVFWNRALNHEYWWFVGSIGFVSAAIHALDLLSSAVHRRVAIAAAAALGAWLFFATVQDLFLRDDAARMMQSNGAAWNAVFRRDDLIIVPLPTGIDSFYADSWLTTFDPAATPLESVILGSAAGIVPVRRIAFILPPEFAAAQPGAAAALVSGRRVRTIGPAHFVFLFGDA